MGTGLWNLFVLILFFRRCHATCCRTERCGDATESIGFGVAFQQFVRCGQKPSIQHPFPHSALVRPSLCSAPDSLGFAHEFGCTHSKVGDLNYWRNFLNSRVNCPILVLHAEDDHIIPIKLGKKLVESAKQAGKKVTFIEFEGDREFLHKYIHRAHELPDVIRWRILNFTLLFLISENFWTKSKWICAAGTENAPKLRESMWRNKPNNKLRWD